METLSIQRTLKNVADALNNERCTNCQLCSGRAQVVQGVGNPMASVVFVGEYPTLEDDQAGAPFVGAHGELLLKSLLDAGVDPSQCYFTLAVRCVSKGKGYAKPPLPKEVTACKPYLFKELAELRPTLVVALGTIPTKLLTANKSVSVASAHGELFWNDALSCYVMPTFSPLFVVKNLSYEFVLKKDMKTLADALKAPTLKDFADSQSSTKAGVYHVVDTWDKFEAFKQAISTAKMVAVDTETSGLDFTTSELLCASFSWEEGVGYALPITRYAHVHREEQTQVVKKRKTKAGVVEKMVTKTETVVVDAYEPFWGDKQGAVEEFLRDFLASDVEKTGANYKFDAKVFLKRGWKTNNLAFDVVLAHSLVDENLPHGLKECATFYTSVGDYSRGIDEWFASNGVAQEKRNYAAIPVEMLYPYAAKDAEVTLRLTNIFSRFLAANGLNDIFYRIILPSSITLTNAEFEGVLIDLAYVEEARKAIVEDMNAIEAQIKSMGYDVSLSSTLDMTDLLFKKLKLPIRKRTPTGAPSTDEEALSGLVTLHPIPKLLLEHRKAEKLLTTYVEGFKEHLKADGRVHTTFLLHATDTGRLSSSNPSLQTIPKTASDNKHSNKIKNMIVARPGWSLIEGDAKQGEFRWWGQMSLDPKLVEDIKNDTDVHRNTAAEAFGVEAKDVTDDMRNQAKTAVFAVLYGAGAKKVADELGCSVEFAKKLIDTFFARYPIAKMWLDQTTLFAKTNGYVRNYFGRVRHLPNIWSQDREIAAKASRQARNSPIQSALSDMNNNTMNRIVRKFTELGLRGKVLLVVHDSIILEVPDDELDVSLKIFNEAATTPILGTTVPFTYDLKYGKRWGSLTKAKL